MAVAGRESEQRGQAGAERYRAWIMDRFTLEARAGEIVVAALSG
jgi:hypothetical protein